MGLGPSFEADETQAGQGRLPPDAGAVGQVKDGVLVGIDISGRHPIHRHDDLESALPATRFSLALSIMRSEKSRAWTLSPIRASREAFLPVPQPTSAAACLQDVHVASWECGPVFGEKCSPVGRFVVCSDHSPSSAVRRTVVRRKLGSRRYAAWDFAPRTTLMDQNTLANAPSSLHDAPIPTGRYVATRNTHNLAWRRVV